MNSFFAELSSNFILVTAVLAALAAAIAGGIVGSYVVAKRIVFISGSISHAVLGGIGLFTFLQFITKSSFFSPLLGAIFAALFFAALIGFIHIKYKEREDSIIAAIWSLGMALGVIFITLVPNGNAALLDFLFGNLLWARMEDVYMLLALDAIIIISALLLHQRFLAISFDETESYIQKQPVYFLYFFLLFLVALTVVLMIQVVGAILVISLLCLPAAIANLFTKSLGKMIYISVLLSCAFSFLGIYLSYVLNWPPGATIAFVITIFYFISLPLKRRYA